MQVDQEHKSQSLEFWIFCVILPLPVLGTHNRGLALVIGPPLSNWTPAKRSSILPVMRNLLCMMFHKNKATFICKLLPFWFLQYVFILHTSFFLASCGK